jgi:tetrapyrrole methylase family protein/MazG family protein
MKHRSDSVQDTGKRVAAISVDLQPFADVVATLRAPGGCEWDRAQTHNSLIPYLVEESAELADAIRAGDPAHICEELGDVLLQVVLHAQVATDNGWFTLQDVCDGISAKMVERHPHVFAEPEALHPDEVARRWNDRKRHQSSSGVLGRLPLALPALDRAEKLTARAATVGFDWENAEQVFGKIDEEIQELKEAFLSGDVAHATTEIGDLLFAITNLSRKMGVSSSDALRGTMGRFESRFAWIETAARQAGTPLETLSLEQMDALWKDAKEVERALTTVPVSQKQTTHE